MCVPMACISNPTLSSDTLGVENNYLYIFTTNSQQKQLKVES